MSEDWNHTEHRVSLAQGLEIQQMHPQLQFCHNTSYKDNSDALLADHSSRAMYLQV